MTEFWKAVDPGRQIPIIEGQQWNIPGNKYWVREYVYAGGKADPVKASLQHQLGHITADIL